MGERDEGFYPRHNKIILTLPGVIGIFSFPLYLMSTLVPILSSFRAPAHKELLYPLFLTGTSCNELRPEDRGARTTEATAAFKVRKEQTRRFKPRTAHRPIPTLDEFHLFQLTSLSPRRYLGPPPNINYKTIHTDLIKNYDYRSTYQQLT